MRLKINVDFEREDVADMIIGLKNLIDILIEKLDATTDNSATMIIPLGSLSISKES